MIVISGQTSSYGLGRLIVSWEAMTFTAIELPSIDRSDIISLKATRTVQQLKQKRSIVQLKSRYQTQHVDD